MHTANKTCHPHPNAFPVPECCPRDAQRAAAVAGCGTRSALVAVKMIETPDGLRSALARERNNLGRSSIIAAIELRIKEVGAIQ
jgi:hypothetical protein